MGAMSDYYIGVIEKGCKALFEWDECAHDELCDRLGTTTLKLIVHLIQNNTVFEGDARDKAAIKEALLDGMRAVLVYAQYGKDLWLYSKNEQLEGFDAMSALLGIIE